MNGVAWLSALYLLAAGGLALYGALGAATLVLYLRHREHYHDGPCPVHLVEETPFVTVQLPIFNEQFVVNRLIHSAARLDWPRNRLQIQVIDDSNDDTTDRAGRLVSHYRQQGINISLLHRSHRTGFKAGALEAARGQADGEYIAVFDADFRPDPDFLQRTIPYFLVRPDVGVIQTRWGHLNSQESPITAAQTIGLDKHFAMEQLVRHRANLFPKFNGSAGIWRRHCLADAGGWLADTVCEDLCLSTRAILKGWRFCFLNDVIARAELPRTVSAFKSQQSRWAKGSIQCLMKYGPAILAAREQSPLARLFALVSMGSYLSYFFLCLLLFLQLPLMLLNYQPPAALAMLALLGISQPLLLICGQRQLYRDWGYRLRHLPTLTLLAIGISASTTRAVLEALTGRRHSFVRTPKGRDNGNRPAYKPPFDRIILHEFGLAAYAGAGMGFALARQNYGALPFLAFCLLGFGFVGVRSLWEQL